MTRALRLACGLLLAAVSLSPAAAQKEETWDKLASCAGALRVTAKAAATPEEKKAATARAEAYFNASMAAHRTERRSGASAAREAVREHDAANVRGFSKEPAEDVEAFVNGCPELPAR